MKSIGIDFRDEAYYGAYLGFEILEEEPNIDKFLLELKNIYKENTFLQQFINGADIMDFIDTLSAKGTQTELFERIILNLEYIDSIKDKARKIDLSEKIDAIIYYNSHPYKNEEEITVFGRLCPLLKDNQKFIEWFNYEFKVKDEIIYSIIFNNEESKKSMIKKLESMIESEDRYIIRSNNDILDSKNNIKNYRTQIEDLINSKEKLDK